MSNWEPEIPQSDWYGIVKAADFPVGIISEATGIKPSILNKYFTCEVKPRLVNAKLVEEVVKKIKYGKGRRLPYHGSYGYATPEQIKLLEELKLGPDRDKVLSDIKKQNDAKGWTL